MNILLLKYTNLLAMSEGYRLMFEHLIAAIVFAGLGILVLLLSIWIIDKLTPFSVKKEIEEDQNIALAIIMAAFILGISMIISAAIQG